MAGRNLRKELQTLLYTKRKLIALCVALFFVSKLLLSHGESLPSAVSMYRQSSAEGPEPIVFALIVHGNETAYEQEIMIKVRLTRGIELTAVCSHVYFKARRHPYACG